MANFPEPIACNAIENHIMFHKSYYCTTATMPGTCTVPGTLLLPRARTSVGQRSFAVFGPATWNSLPPSLNTPELSLSTFKRRLKTQLFQHPWSIVRRCCDWSASSAPYTNIQTQLNSTHSYCKIANFCGKILDSLEILVIFLWIFKYNIWQ